MRKYISKNEKQDEKWGLLHLRKKIINILHILQADEQPNYFYHKTKETLTFHLHAYRYFRVSRIKRGIF